MLGFRIHQIQRRVDKRWVEAFRSIPVANISDVMSRMASGGTELRPMHAGNVMAGPAITVRSAPGDNLMLHKALAMAEPGDVIVVDAGGERQNAITGEIMVAVAKKKGLGGFVINGPIRDIGAISKGDFPVYATGVTHRGPYKNGPGEINVPISINGMVINPGDLILGDEDGLLCVPFEHVEAIHEAAAAKHKAEEKIMAEIAAGNYAAPWVDEALERLGCEYVR